MPPKDVASANPETPASTQPETAAPASTQVSSAVEPVVQPTSVIAQPQAVAGPVPGSAAVPAMTPPQTPGADGAVAGAPTAEVVPSAADGDPRHEVDANTDYRALSEAVVADVKAAIADGLSRLPDHGGREPDAVKHARSALMGARGFVDVTL